MTIAQPSQAHRSGHTVTSAVIPEPQSTQYGEGSLPLHALTHVTVDSVSAEPVADVFLRSLRTWTGRDLSAHAAGERGSVRFSLTSETADAHSSRYTVEVTEQGITASAASLEGLHHASMTVVQLIGTAATEIPFVRIVDQPGHEWRGLSLDVVRSFSSVEQIKRVIDLLSLYKFSVLHVHLSDNEGWRLEIPGWPKLTPTNPDGSREYYTTDEFRGLVAYAAEHAITLVPEIDLPGHVASVLRVYPELADPGSILEGMIPRAYLDVRSPEATRFVEEVLTEVASLTPGPSLHIGGDEAFGMDDDDYVDFVSRSIEFVRGLGKEVVGWQEVSRAAVGPGDTVQHWIDFALPEDEAPQHGEDSPTSQIPADLLEMLQENFAKAADDAGRAAAKGARFIMSPTSHAYLDQPLAESSNDAEQNETRPRLGLPHYPAASLEAYYDWSPESLAPPEARDRVRGVEAAMWCETIQSPADLEMLLMPRLPGLAEVGWSQPDAPRDVAAYLARLAEHAPMWDHAGWNWFRADTVAWRDGASS